MGVPVFFDSEKLAVMRPLDYLVRRYLKLIPLSHDQFAVMLFEYD